LIQPEGDMLCPYEPSRPSPWADKGQRTAMLAAKERKGGKGGKGRKWRFKSKRKKTGKKRSASGKSRPVAPGPVRASGTRSKIKKER
jgi:hypothetical protein